VRDGHWLIAVGATADGEDRAGREQCEGECAGGASSDRLIDALWGANPPASANGSLHNLVSTLRKAFGDGRLITHPGGGYQLNLNGDDLDAARLDALSADGRDALAAGDPERRARLLAEALALWRGPAFGELAYESALQAEVARLEELRLVVVEDRVDAELALGRHAKLVGELEALVVGPSAIRRRTRCAGSAKSAGISAERGGRETRRSSRRRVASRPLSSGTLRVSSLRHRPRRETPRDHARLAGRRLTTPPSSVAATVLLIEAACAPHK
jgi:hypothetical protein